MISCCFVSLPSHCKLHACIARPISSTHQVELHEPHQKYNHMRLDGAGRPLRVVLLLLLLLLFGRACLAAVVVLILGLEAESGNGPASEEVKVEREPEEAP